MSDDSSRRSYRRRNSEDGLTDVNSPETPSKSPIYMSENIDIPQVSEVQIDAINQTIADDDRVVLSIYLNIPEINADVSIPERTRTALLSNLVHYPFWNMISQRDKDQLQSLYLDYYMANLLIRAYNDALLMFNESETPVDAMMLKRFRDNRIKILNRKSFLDDALLFKINESMDIYNAKVLNVNPLFGDEVNRALRDIVNDLKSTEDEEDIMRLHDATIEMLHADTVKYDE